MNGRDFKKVHLIGVGGINISAVAKLLLASGISVSGSDVAENEQTQILQQRGAMIARGHAAEHVPADAELVIYSSAVPVTNPEREEAKRRNIPELTNFQFLAEWFYDAKTILVTGTHGKSTTTAMLGLMLERAKLDPTFVVGSKVPSFPEGNLRIGSPDLFVIEGDEYARHFLEFSPWGIVINNIELDHTDVFANLEEMVDAFRQLLHQIKSGGVVVANTGDVNVAKLLKEESEWIAQQSIRVIGFGEHEMQAWNVKHEMKEGWNHIDVAGSGVSYRFVTHAIGAFNALNAAGSALLAIACGADYASIATSLELFSGIWRRFERLGELNGATIYSDYGHHPTAVAQTLAAAHDAFPERRIVLCFQPHHRNRTKHLFFDFVPSFDVADVLVLCEIYDVAGRDAKEDEMISSQDLVDAIIPHDADRGVTRTVEYAKNPQEAVTATMKLVQAGDIVIVMGAGDIDGEVRKLL